MKDKKKRLMKIAKQLLDKELMRKIDSITDEAEKIQSLEYSIIAKLEKEHLFLENKIQEFKQKGRDIFTAENKLILIPSKIKHFQVEFSEKEFEKILQLFKEIKMELKNV